MHTSEERYHQVQKGASVAKEIKEAISEKKVSLTKWKSCPNKENQNGIETLAKEMHVDNN